MTLRSRVCLNRSVFLLFSLSCELSPFLLHEHVLSLLVSKLCILSLHSLYKFHVSCFVFSHFNSLPPASLSLLLHFNCDFHGYLTRSHSTCIKCSSGISLLLALKPRLLYLEGYFIYNFNDIKLKLIVGRNEMCRTSGLLKNAFLVTLQRV